jgi:hypothetical protein
MTTKTMNEQLAEINKQIKETNSEQLCATRKVLLQFERNRLIADMKIVEELKEKIEKEFRFTDLQCERIDKLFKEIVGR